MTEIFKTILILSLLGSVLSIPLLALKPITSKKFPAVWQYVIWIVVMFSMILPVYKLIPAGKTQTVSVALSKETVHVIPRIPYASPKSQEQPQLSEAITMQKHTDSTHNINKSPIMSQTESNPKFQLNIPDYLAYIWFWGTCIFLLTISISYAIYLTKKRKNSITLTDNTVLGEVKAELGIKRHIIVRTSPVVGSPMLVGIIFPTVYLPCREISDKNLRMIFLHELTHFKRKDLIFKWLSLFTNAIHWFNPFAYLLCSNLSEACEISCDMSVTKKMSDTEQKTYMKTILDLVE